MKSKAIGILGMHRSGTSTITRSINFLGAYIGEEKNMVEPGFDNPEGFWELREVVALHKRIMNALKRGGDEIVAPLPRQWHLRDEIRPFREDLRSLIRSSFDGYSLWAWKDPRTCLTFDLWKDLLNEADVELSAVFVVRHPLDVAISLKKRNGYSFDKSFGIWFNHNISALESIAAVPTVFLSYDRFLDGWETELSRCAAFLGIPWPSDEHQLKEKMNSFIRPDLRHSKANVDDREQLPIPVWELYQLLLKQTTSTLPPDKSFFDAISGLACTFHAYASFFCPDLDNCFERERRMAE